MKYMIRIQSVCIFDGPRYEEVEANSEEEARTKVIVEDDEFISTISAIEKELDEDVDMLRTQIWGEITSPNMDVTAVQDMMNELEDMGEDPFSIL